MKLVEKFDHACIWLYVKMRFWQPTPEQLDALTLLIVALFYLAWVALVTVQVVGQ